MLVIRKEQMETLRASMSRRFERRMLEHIKNNFPDRIRLVSDEIISNVVQDSIRRAESYSIQYEDDIRRFIEYLIIYGTLLDTNQETRWIGEILKRTDITGSAKMDLIDDHELQTLRESYD